MIEIQVRSNERRLALAVDPAMCLHPSWRIHQVRCPIPLARLYVDGPLQRIYAYSTIGFALPKLYQGAGAAKADTPHPPPCCKGRSAFCGCIYPAHSLRLGTAVALSQYDHYLGRYLVRNIALSTRPTLSS
jgi:hypothetical protein